MPPILYDVDTWLQKNVKFFEPPICNKLMYKDGQLKTFFVGGPNSRKDFHMEAGEEFFYMLKGDMILIVFEQGQFKELSIKEGEVFMLPHGIPHSPQRFADTIGLVIERERYKHEMDCLRYYIEGSDDILYEKWFYCSSLEELGPLIKEYFSSEQYRTGKPVPGTIPKDKPVKQDYERKLDAPFSLKSWLEENKNILETTGKKKLFQGDYNSRIHVLGKGMHVPDQDLPETFLCQMEGIANLKVNDNMYIVKPNQTVLCETGEKFELENADGCRTLSVVMNVVKE